MRTTIALDPDVVQALEQLRSTRKESRKQLVNEALRAGLKAIQKVPKRRKRVYTRSVDLGEPLIPWELFDNNAALRDFLDGDEPLVKSSFPI